MIRLLQAMGQRVFLWVEAGFNTFFGQELNPFYHLGAIAFFLFWIVLGTGLYLYAFFDTGVADAYSSVEYLTREQWYLGGVIRSLHRYASDGMVLVMLLHMARYFVFGRYRDFRWFSWVSGIALLWLVYASGINGYMLPWDQLGQFVATATAEWLDWFPFFAGAASSNFTFRGSVNDRLFSLLSFLHIGIPLGVLILAWIHTQRVPRAQINPPLRIMLPLSVALVVLCLIHPAVSQAPADLGVVPADLAFDWYYLLIYPLIYSWSAGAVWALAGAATLLLVILPWLPSGARRDTGAEFHATFRPGNRSATVRSGETLLEAGLRQGIALPYDCRNGGCGVCKVTLLQGQIDHGVYQKSVLADTERELGKALLCTAMPLSDVDIELDSTVLPVRVWHSHVKRMEQVAPEVMLVWLEPEDQDKIQYRAGQYIDILLDDNQKRAFSFATAPGTSELIELHVRRIPGGRFTSHVFDSMKVGDQVRFEGPIGNFALNEEKQRPILFVAGATGFAPVKSILEYAFSQDVRRPMVLYWGVRRPTDLYMVDLARRWSREHANFSFVPVISEPSPEDQWEGRTGLVHQAILEDFPSLQGYELYACGSAQMVRAARPEFLAHGLSEDACFSDAFDFAGQDRAEEVQ
jgi:NAD(P)H-flavin reductase/quinol-cytochrome oxidoreductase complex cytochrome b subunit